MSAGVDCVDTGALGVPRAIWGAAACSKFKPPCALCGAKRVKKDNGSHFYPLVGWVCTPCAHRVSDETPMSENEYQPIPGGFVYRKRVA